jgi:FlaA1/EpsC-like NDP-sugar epimerase
VKVKLKRFLKKLHIWQAPIRNWALLLGDLFLISVAVLGSFALRFEFSGLFYYYLPQAWRMIILAVIIKPIIYYLFGLYRRLWAYASIRELMLVVTAVTAASMMLSIAVTIMTYYQLQQVNYIGFPRSVLVIDWMLSMILVGGLRFSSRLIAESRSTASEEPSDNISRRMLIVGAGDAGALVAREIQKNPQLNLELVCFLDDDKAKQKQQIHGIPVVGTLDDLPRVITRRRIQEVVIAIPTASGDVVRKVANYCHEKSVTFRTMPGMYELIGGKVSVKRLREVNINDLLRRIPAKIDDRRIGSALGGKRILVSGAGGSIGSELCRQIARWGPSALVILGHGENSIFETLLELEENYPSLPIHPVIADIRDQDRIENAFATLQPEVIFHAAAHKHVPLMEVNVEEAITNNVLGTRNIVEVAQTYGVERLVMISTDKAIRPTSVYGATKRLAELLVLNAAHSSQRPFSVVRFGNVLGSRGSVVPRFQRQIEAGGPVRITHPDMERYFMTIPEAVHLVLQASALGQGGEVFVLRMGDQVRILTLAEDLIRLSGLDPEKDIEILFTGIRPGEKLSEELWDRWATYEPTNHPDIVQLAKEDIISDEELNQAVEELIHLAREGYPTEIIKRLDRIIPGASVRSTPPPDLTSIV